MYNGYCLWMTYLVQLLYLYSSLQTCLRGIAITNVLTRRRWLGENAWIETGGKPMSLNLHPDILPISLGSTKVIQCAGRCLGESFAGQSLDSTSLRTGWVMDRHGNKCSRKNLINSHVEHLNMSLCLEGSKVYYKKRGFHVSLYIWWCLILKTWKLNMLQLKPSSYKDPQHIFTETAWSNNSDYHISAAKGIVLTCLLSIYF